MQRLKREIIALTNAVNDAGLQVPVRRCCDAGLRTARVSNPF